MSDIMRTPMGIAWNLLKWDNAGERCKYCAKLMTEGDNYGLPNVCYACLMEREMYE